MKDIKYDNEKLVEDGQAFMDSFKAQMSSIVQNTLGEAYANLLPYIETDAWTNYREELRIELEREYKFSRFKQEWAVNFRRAVFVENREEISKLIEQDILKRIKHLEDCRQEFEQFRYTPLGDTYQCLKNKVNTTLELLVSIQKHGLNHYEDCNNSGYDDMTCTCGMEKLEQEILKTITEHK